MAAKSNTGRAVAPASHMRRGLHLVAEGAPARPAAIGLDSFRDLPPATLQLYGLRYSKGVMATYNRDPAHARAYAEFRGFVLAMVPIAKTEKMAGTVASEILRANEFGSSNKLQAQLFDFTVPDQVVFKGTLDTILSEEKILKMAGGLGNFGRVAIELFSAQADTERVAAALAEHDYRLHT